MRSRRSVLGGAAAMALVAVPTVSLAQAPTPLMAIAATLGAAADAVGKLSDNVLKATQDGMKLWDASTARLHRDQYVDLTARLGTLYSSQNTYVIRSLTEYIRFYQTSDKPLGPAAKATLETSWRGLKQHIDQTLDYVKSILGDLRSDRSLFVATPAYRDLMTNLDAKSAVLLALAQLPPPMTTPDIEDLKRVDLEFERLHTALGGLIDAVNSYIRAS